MKIILHSLTTGLISVVILRPFFNAVFKVSSNPGSWNGALPVNILETLVLSESTPVTEYFFDARTEANERPTKPNPMIPIFMLLRKLFYIKVMLFYRINLGLLCMIQLC